MAVAFRRAVERDMPFVVSGWSSSYRTSYSAGMVTMGDWAVVMHDQLPKILARPGVVVMLAHDPDNRTGRADLQGFIAADLELAPPLVLYVYVKEPYRRSGLARALFGAIGIDPSSRFDYACKTAVVHALAHKIPLARWQPLLARFEPPARKP